MQSNFFIYHNSTKPHQIVLLGCNWILNTSDSHESYQIFLSGCNQIQILSNFYYWIQLNLSNITTLTNLIKFFFIDAIKIFHISWLSQILSNSSFWMKLKLSYCTALTTLSFFFFLDAIKLKSYQMFWYTMTLSNLIKFFFLDAINFFIYHETHKSYQILLFGCKEIFHTSWLPQILSNFYFWMQSNFSYFTTLTNLIKFLFLDAMKFFILHDSHKSYQIFIFGCY